MLAGVTLMIHLMRKAMACITADNFIDVNGTTVGLGPLAHIATYKMCSNFSCPDDAILATINATIDNEVDVLSLSLHL